MNPAVRVSIVSYTNTLPFRWALRNSNLLERMDLQEDIPSICAQKLKFRQVDLALVPVAVIPELVTYHIETDYCIGATGRVDSVKLYSSVPITSVTRLLLDYQSQTSVTLARILCKFHWKIAPEFVQASPGFESGVAAGEAMVVIGDRTFSINGRYPYEYDLAEVWQQFTGLPFVFAAWVSNEPLPGDFIASFNSTLRYGVEHVADAIRDLGAPPALTSGETLHYLTQCIDYRRDERKMKALDRFLELIARL